MKRTQAIKALELLLRHYEAGTVNDIAARNARKALEALSKSLHVAVVLEGGLVQSVITDNPHLVGMGFDVIDYDTDGADQDDIAKIRQGDGSESEAVIGGGYIVRSEISY